MAKTDIILKKGKDKSALRRHPWIFSGAIHRIDETIKDGDLAAVVSSDDTLIGWGHYQAKGSISVRMIHYGENKPDQDFWNEKIADAYRLRESLPFFLNKNANAYRLIHGEGDGLPGLVIDVYGENIVVQCHSLGMSLSAENIGLALQNQFKKSVKNIYLREAHSKEEKHGHYLLRENDQTECLVQEYDCTFSVNWEEGQKTGFFIDQRENRRIVASYCEGKKVLNAFSYTGGFSIAALKNGAKNVTSVDISAKATELANENATLNNCAENHEAITADVLSYLSDLKEDFDVIILDPPAFAKHQSSKHKAIQAYRRINQEAIARIPKGGFLFTFSCSQVIDKITFEGIVRSAAINLGREVKIIERLGQPQDHPISIFHPEGDYLKGLALYVC